MIQIHGLSPPSALHPRLQVLLGRFFIKLPCFSIRTITSAAATAQNLQQAQLFAPPHTHTCRQIHTHKHCLGQKIKNKKILLNLQPTLKDTQERMDDGPAAKHFTEKQISDVTAPFFPAVLTKVNNEVECGQTVCRCVSICVCVFMCAQVQEPERTRAPLKT